MPRSRSRSRERRRSRSKSRSPRFRRDRDRRRSRSRDRDRDRRRSRSRSPRAFTSFRTRDNRRDRKSRSRSRGRLRDPYETNRRNGPDESSNQIVTQTNNEIIESEPLTEEEAAMKSLMGFAGFNSTKNKKVQNNMTDVVTKIVTKRKYRQYMNRRGGFNRPLDPIA